MTGSQLMLHSAEYVFDQMHKNGWMIMVTFTLDRDLKLVSRHGEYVYKEISLDGCEPILMIKEEYEKLRRLEKQYLNEQSQIPCRP